MSSTDQCVVAVSPSSRPAAPSTSDPVHTDVVNVVVVCALRTQSSTRSSSISARVPTPPGKTMMSGSATSSNVASACDAEEAVLGADLAACRGR